MPPPTSGSQLVGCSSATTRIVASSDTHLDPSCTYLAGVDVVGSGTTLDCQGATIRGTLSTPGAGILVSAPVGTDLADVAIRNCRVEGFTNSLRVTRPGFRSLPPGGEYLDELTDIVVEHNTFTGSRGVGVFVDGYVSGVSIRHNLIDGAGSSGVYLETGSRGSLVTANTIVNNGYISNGPGGELVDFAGLKLWVWGVGREGLSIDGSYDNTVSDNTFARNSNGGVFLYKNCGEYPSRPSYFERRFHADHNVITGNRFLAERNGVWVGSRMSENTLPMECTDPAYVDEPGRRVVLDYASDNTVSDNVFADVVYGVRVEDDNNRVIGNRFGANSPDRHAVIIGAPVRAAVLGRPVTGTVINDNVSEIPGNTDPYRSIAGSTGTLESGNTALGVPAMVCPGVDPPRQSIIFVLAVAQAGPNGEPPATTPDLTVPLLGALPPCTAS